MLTRDVAEAVFREAVADCDPARRVGQALVRLPARFDHSRRIRGLAIGKAALAMARAVGPVDCGLVVAPAPGPVPMGWELMIGSHPEPDARSREAGIGAMELVRSARPSDYVLALISGGASALAEISALPDDEHRRLTRALMHAGVSISELNTVRSALSAIKAGELSVMSPVPVITLAVSDVVGDDLAVIGSAPTVGPWTLQPGVPVDYDAFREAIRQRAISILTAHGLAIPDRLETAFVGSPPVVREDHAEVIAPMRSFADAAIDSLELRDLAPTLIDTPLTEDVAAVAEHLVAGRGLRVAWGEPTLRVPERHGEGGRAQQLALQLARRIAGTSRSALVIGSDGVDGPPPATRPPPAGAFVDGTTWEAIIATGIDPFASLGRCDAGTALAAVGALVVTGPTGINHADLVIVS